MSVTTVSVQRVGRGSDGNRTYWCRINVHSVAFHWCFYLPQTSFVKTKIEVIVPMNDVRGPSTILRVMIVSSMATDGIVLATHPSSQDDERASALQVLTTTSSDMLLTGVSEMNI